jgi:predicted PurR-regulated permease PerM
MSYRQFQVYFFVTVLVLSSAVTLAVFQPYLTLLAFGGVLAIVSSPIYRWLKKMFKSETASAFLTSLSIGIIILIPIVLFLAALAGELINIFGKLRSYFETGTLEVVLTKFLPETLHSQIPTILDQAFGVARTVVQALSNNLVGLFSNAFAILFGFVVILIAVYYLLKDGPKVKTELLALSPLGDEYDELVFQRIAIAVRAVMGGVLIIGLIKGALAGFFFWAFSVPAPLFWGAMTAVASFIPILGSSLITVPAAGYLFVIGDYGAGAALLAVSIGIIGVVDNFLQPKLVESRTKIHPLLILLSILGGIQFYGFAGFVLGPLTLSVTMALIDIYKKEFRNYMQNMDGE